MTATAGRHLLFGLLALQNGFINQGQLLAGFQAWTLDKSRSLADHLEAQGDLTAAKRALLEALAEVHLDAHGGDVELSLAAVSAGKSTKESLARIADPEINATLGHVGSSAQRSTHDDEDPDRTGTYSVGSATSDGQRFRVLRPHARGGLGAVFVALDGELHREVALKQILDSHADDPVIRQRFVVEAEITGGLEHPGIVPVYGLGTYGDGRPYYAMRFIKGDSLKEAIERCHGDQGLKSDPGRRSLELRKLLRQFMDVCNAIDYAHSRGILHRDIKPGNIIVGKHGETLVVDWGLAKPLGRAGPGRESGERSLVASATSGSAETLPGSVLGTPAYMSPEQACGDLDKLGLRSDVYSLGATLYCLLTGRPPFEGEDIGEVLRKVQRGEFARPRQLDLSLDKALEAVCLKAMAQKPEDRYVSCRALAEDVERWMADEPVSAWCEPWRWRARRWLARHRSLVASAAAALLIIAVVSSLAAILIERARRDEAQALAARTKALAAEIKAKSEADRRLKDANLVVETFLSAVSDELNRVQGAQPVRRRLLQQAAEYFARVSSERTGDRFLDYEALRATYRAGRIQRALGEIDAAIVQFRDAARRGEDLLRIAPENVDYLSLLASTEIETGVCMLRLGRKDESEKAYRRAIVGLGKALAQEPDHAEMLNHLASAHNNLGVILLGQPERAEPEYRRAIELRRRLTVLAPANREYLDDLGSSLTNLGLLQDDRGNRIDAVRLQRESVEVRERAVAREPENPQYLRGLALSRMNLAMVLGNAGQDDEAARVFALANAELSALVERNSNVPEFRALKAMSLIGSTDVLIRLSRGADALATSRAAVDEYEGMSRRTPRSREYRFYLGLASIGRSSALDSTKEHLEALPPARRACEVIDAVVAEEPGNPEYARFQGAARVNLGNVLHHLGRDGEASAALRRGIEILDVLARSRPDLPPVRDTLGEAFESLAAYHKDRGEAGPFLRAIDEAFTLREAAFERAKDLPQPRVALVKIHRERGEALVMLGRPAEAAAEADQLAELRPRDAGDQFVAARLLSQAAGAAQGDQARTFADRALKRLRKARRIGPVEIADLTQDPRFAALRLHPDYPLLIMDLAFPADPLAPGR